MRTLLTPLLALAVAIGPVSAPMIASAQTPPATQAQQEAAQHLAADPLNTSAPYAYIMDGDTGAELYSKAGETPIIPASMSKLMVYYLVFERLKEGRLKMEDEFTVSEHAWRTGGAGTAGSTMFLKLGSKVSVENLLKGAVIQSGNDACIVLAEGLAGSEEAFSREMTAKGREIGLKHSTFANATGLDHPDHRMSAHDIALLGYRLIKDFPDFYPMFQERTFTWNGITQPNRNPLLREMDGADGIKTGHLSASGYGLVGSAVRDGKRRIIVLQGLKSETERRTEGARVMRSAFVDFMTFDLVAKDVEVATANVWLGEQQTVKLVATESAIVGLHANARNGIRSVVVYKGPLQAPVNAGDIVGDLVITAPGRPEIRIPVAAQTSVKKLGIFGRALVGLRGS